MEEVTTEAMKQKKADKLPSKEVRALIDIGIPLKMAVFHRSILSFGDLSAGDAGTPETALHAKETDPKKRSAKPARTAQIWYTPHGLVIGQHGIYKIIPLANVSDTVVL